MAWTGARRFLALPLLLAMIASLPALADNPAPSRMRAACERMLLNSRWVQPEVRAQVHPEPVQTHVLPSHVIAVQLPGQNSPVRYRRTNRSLVDLRFEGLMPRSLYHPDGLNGLRVLDLGCGDGYMVEDWRRAGVDAVGVDVHLDDYQLSKPYFVRASADATGLAPESVDVIFMIQGPITYLFEDKAMVQRFLTEAHRLLKPGGVIRIAPLHLNGDFRKNGGSEHDFKGTAFEHLPAGLRIKTFPDLDWFWSSMPDTPSGLPAYWVEIEKIEAL